MDTSNENLYFESEETTKRDVSLDKAKMGLLFLVIIGHILVFYSPNYYSLFKLNPGNSKNTIEAVLSVIYSFHMAAFFIISGATYNKNKNYIEFNLRNIKKLVIPTVIFTVIVLVPVMKYVGTYKNFEFIEWFYNTRNRHLWFVESLVIILFVNRTLDIIPDMKIIKFVLSIVAYYLVMDKIITIKPINLLNYFVYFQLGEVLGKDSLKLSWKSLIIYIALAVFINYMLLIGNKSNKIVEYIKNNHIFTILNALLLTVTFSKVFEIIPTKLCKHQFNVYLFHVPVIYVSMHLIKKYFILDGLTPALVTFVLTIILSFGVSKFLRYLNIKFAVIWSNMKESKKNINSNMALIQSK